MARLESDRGRLLISFQYRGQRCREYLGLPDNRENRRVAARVLREVELELATGKLDYAAKFPASKNLKHFSPAQTDKAERPTLGEFAKLWLQERRAAITPATLYDYERLLETYILPLKLASMRIDAIDDGHVKRFVAEVQAKRTRKGEPVKPRRINMAVARLRTIFATAKRRKLIAEDPMGYVDNLREPKSEVDPLTFEEAQRLLAAATGQDRAVFTVLIFAGLRPNEALALEWKDIDFDRELIKVRRTLSRFGGLGLPKTSYSEREVDMLPPVRVALQEQRARSQLRSEFAFASESGGPLDLTNLRERNWRRLVRKSGLRPPTLYQCRHTFAALQLSRGENPQYLAHQMGHANLEMIIRHYARWTRRPERVGKLGAQLEAEFPQEMPEICQKVAEAEEPTHTRQPSKSLDFTRRIGGAGDGVRTRDVQLGKLAFYH